jgi:hypothetical protein
VRGHLHAFGLAESPPHPALRAGLSPQAGRGDRTRGSFVPNTFPIQFSNSRIVTPPHSRGADHARAMHEVALEKNRGRRESRVPNAPAASRAKVKKHTSMVTTGSPELPDLPCAMVLTAYNVLSPVTGLFCHRHRRNCFRQLDSSVGASGPHAFAVHLKRRSSTAPSASTHPASRP